MKIKIQNLLRMRNDSKITYRTGYESHCKFFSIFDTNFDYYNLNIYGAKRINQSKLSLILIV